MALKTQSELQDMRDRLQELRDNARMDIVVGGEGGTVEGDLAYMKAQYALQLAEAEYYEELRKIAADEQEAI